MGKNEKFNYKTISDSPRMGLNNKLCIYLVAYCKSKRVYLSKKDISAKRCMGKVTPDMISVERCKQLVMVDILYNYL